MSPMKAERVQSRFWCHTSENSSGRLGENPPGLWGPSADFTPLGHLCAKADGDMLTSPLARGSPGEGTDGAVPVGSGSPLMLAGTACL